MTIKGSGMTIKGSGMTIKGSGMTANALVRIMIYGMFNHKVEIE